MKYAQIGDIIFEVQAYRTHKEEQTFPYARHETIKPPSILQYMGERELRKVSLSVRWHFHWCDPQKEYERLLEFASSGKAAPLIIAEKILGEYVIERIDADFQQINAFGAATVIDAEIELTEYIQKELQKKEIESKKKKKKTQPQYPKYRIVSRVNEDGYSQKVIERP